jgi:hypothetical protein
MSLPLTNIIRVSILTALRGLSNVNTSAIGFITDEVPIPNDFGDFRAYLEPTGVGLDFGTNSETYRIALAIFNQNPNLLSGGGVLLIIPRDQTAAASAATILGSIVVDFTQLGATDYNINLDVDGGGASDLLIGQIDTTDLSTIEASLNSTAVTSAGAVFEVSGEVSAAKITLKSSTTGATSTLTVGSATTGTDIATLLGLSGSATGAAAGVERIKDTIIRTVNSIPYFGLVYNEKMTDADLTEVAALVQSLDIMQFVGSNLQADIAGIFTTLKNAGYTQTRMLYYSNSENDALDFAASYASRGLSVNFDGDNTMLTMNLKEIVGLVTDPIYAGSSGQTVYDSLKLAGVDTYADFGVAGVGSFGANKYFDEVYIELALKLRLQVAGFNYLKQTNTKITQTEDGMDGLKGAYRKVMKQFVTNNSFAPGAWNGSTRFGDPEDHDRNILEQGFWIYSLPVADQSQTSRDERIAPLVQIAAKSSGAIHSSDVTVLIER